MTASNPYQSPVDAAPLRAKPVRVISPLTGVLFGVALTFFGFAALGVFGLISVGFWTSSNAFGPRMLFFELAATTFICFFFGVMALLAAYRQFCRRRAAAIRAEAKMAQIRLKSR
ncbi:MAG: hypothetical protein DWQ31_14860 [Planctomycetota bacterium]|nr:MAG: hypothetical protein DWQ31_14860 [Planctomycetota bacterium]REJ87528.1 MAG: hypothetical protein DWQ35_21315 [Planctomycetota bacterium]REK31095.1 MAG: hypothetical protein DWQ42_01025 [Planctomycetota bacterium]REK44341.1 MAG: hypothetical protein DWQ46_10025 [Planctomycetota bacterium]